MTEGETTIGDVGRRTSRGRPPKPSGGPEMTMLVDAMWAVTARECSVEPSVRDIVAEAGLAPKAFYRHFESKDDLLLLARREGTRGLVTHLERRMARQMPGRSLLAGHAAAARDLEYLIEVTHRGLGLDRR